MIRISQVRSLRCPQDDANLRIDAHDSRSRTNSNPNFHRRLNQVSPEIRLHRKSTWSVHGSDRPPETKQSQMDSSKIPGIANAILELPVVKISQDTENGGPRDSDIDTSEVEKINFSRDSARISDSMLTEFPTETGSPCNGIRALQISQSDCDAKWIESK
jgi:hypothetical protein